MQCPCFPFLATCSHLLSGPLAVETMSECAAHEMQSSHCCELSR